MSLKAVHLIFIAASTIVVAVFGAWAFAQYSASGSIPYLGTAAAAFLGSAALVVYARGFLRRTKGIGLLALAWLLAAPTDLLACPVCFGRSDSPMAQGMSYGVMALLGVTAAVLAGFAAFFLFLMRRMSAFEAAETAAAEPPISTPPFPQRAS
jgi:hypothetical protein